MAVITIAVFGALALLSGNIVNALTRVAGYPLMALSRMYENYHDESYLATCEQIMDWLEEWAAEDGHYTYNAYGPPGGTQRPSAYMMARLS